jgi:signal transduction histidine kinase
MEQQLQFFTGIIVTTILLGTLLLFTLWSLMKLQRHKRQAWEQLSLLAEVLARERERAAITDQLHEDFGAVLSVVKMLINNVQPTESWEKEQQRMAAAHLDDLINRIRAFKFDHLPYLLQENRLVEAIHQYVKYINDNHKELISLTIDDHLTNMGAHKTLCIYRIIQEIIENTIRHANASSLEVELKKKNHLLLIKTKDNGVGFNYEEELERGKGFGLNHMVNRIKVVKGNMKVSSKRGGTMFIIEIPL